MTQNPINQNNPGMVAQAPQSMPPGVSSSPAPFAAGGLQNLVNSLVSSGKVSQTDVDAAKPIALNQNKTIEQVLIESGKISETDVYKMKATMGGFRFIDLGTFEIPIEILNKLSKDVAEKHIAVPFGEENGQIKIALSDPGDLQKVKFLQIVIAKPLDLYMSSPQQIQGVIDKQYGARISEEVEEALEDVGDVVQLGDTSKDDLKSEDVSEELDSAPVSRIVNMVMEYAVKYKASDVHIEPRDNKVIVRFRISGVLVEKLTLPKKLSKSVVARIKILSNLKIDEHRLPQDGRFQIKSGKTFFDIRVSIMPSVYGEKVVMRLLEQGGGDMSLEETGLRGFAKKNFMDALKKTEGIILVTGPTGSGKTHTLASSIKILNTPEVNILTLEDPVEIRMEGITQVQVKAEIGLTFAAGLRSFLRQDPDIIMVGEIRDSETATLAVQAALTGHMVLATLHTNSASGAIPRLIDMEVESFLLSSTINGILAQRLTRKLCTHCKEAYEANDIEVERLHKELDGLRGFDLFQYPPRKNESGQIVQAPKREKVLLYRGQGCSKCNGSGYSGRIGIFEVLTISEKIGQLIMEHRSAYDIERQATKDGMITLIQDGFLKALEGVTSLEEVLRVIG